jgi:hypothetical protein
MDLAALCPIFSDADIETRLKHIRDASEPQNDEAIRLLGLLEKAKDMTSNTYGDSED